MGRKVQQNATFCLWPLWLCFCQWVAMSSGLFLALDFVSPDNRVLFGCNSHLSDILTVSKTLFVFSNKFARSILANFLFLLILGASTWLNMAGLQLNIRIWCVFAFRPNFDLPILVMLRPISQYHSSKTVNDLRHPSAHWNFVLMPSTR
jgi:hypothetical protein